MLTTRLTRPKCKTIIAFMPILALGVLAFSHVSIAQLTFSAPAALNTNAATDSGNDAAPQVTTDRTGNRVAIWSSADGLGGTVGTDADILVATAAAAADGQGDIVWIAGRQESPAPELFMAQQFLGPGAPVQIIETSFNEFGYYGNLAVVGNAFYSAKRLATRGEMHRWNALTGDYEGAVALSSPLSDHFLGGGLFGIGTTTEGNLLFVPTGSTTEPFSDQRGVPMYSTDGQWIRTYTHPRVQHVWGTPTGNSAAVFMVSQQYPEGEPDRRDVLMFTNSGAYVGAIEMPYGADNCDIMGNKLYVSAYDESSSHEIRVYDLNGTSLPTFSHAISMTAYPYHVYAANNALYSYNLLSKTWVKMDLDGTILGTLEPQQYGTSFQTYGFGVVTSGVTARPASIDFGVADTSRQIVLTSTYSIDVGVSVNTSQAPPVSVVQTTPFDMASMSQTTLTLELDRSAMAIGESLSGSITITVREPGQVPPVVLDTLTIPVEAAQPDIQIVDIVPDEGPTTGGNEVVIYGYNFQDDVQLPSVTFGSLAADLIYDVVYSVLYNVYGTVDKIYVTAPASVTGPGPVDVTVTNRDIDASDTVNDGYTYVGGPVLAVSPAEVLIDWNANQATLQITNQGTDVLDWQLERIGFDPQFLSVITYSPQSGSLTSRNSDVVVFTADKSSMLPGQELFFPNALRLTSNAGDVTIPVRVVQASGAAPVVDVTELVFRGSPGQILNQSFVLANAGQTDLVWSTDSYEELVTTTPSSGILKYLETATIRVTADFTATVPGTTIRTTLAIINATGAGVAIPVTMIVMEPPELSVEPLEVTFPLGAGGFDMNDRFWTLPEAITVTNTGESDLLWTAVTSDDAHVSLSTAGGTLGEAASSPIDVTIDTRGIGFATESSSTVTRTVTFSGAGSTISVLLIIERPMPPQLEFEPAILDFGETLTTLTLRVRNVGEAPFEWQFVPETDAFSLLPPGGTIVAGTDQDVVVTLNRRILPPGRDIETQVELTSIDPAYMPPPVPVLLSVPGPVMRIEPRVLHFLLGETEHQFTIMNDYAGILVWQTSDIGQTVMVTPQTGQIGLAPDSDTVTVTIDRTGLPEGVNTFDLTVVGNGSVAPNADRPDDVAWYTKDETVRIEVSVPAPRPQLAVEPTSLTFEPQDIVLPLNVTNVGVDILRWRVAVDKPFLVVSPTDGFTERETDIVNVTAVRTGLAPGSHTATITVTPLDENGISIVEEAVAVGVTVVVSAETAEPYLDVTPRSLRFPLGTDTLSVEVRNVGGQTLSWLATPQNEFIALSLRAGQISEGVQQVFVTVDRTEMVPGETVMGSIDFTSNGGNAVVLITVETVAAGDPVLSIQPLNLAFVPDVNGQSFLVRNAGGGILKWWIERWAFAPPPGSASPVVYEIAPTGGSLIDEPALVVVRVDKQGVTKTVPGDIEIGYITGTGAEEYYPLNMTVEPDNVDGPALQVRPLEVLFPSTQDQGNLMIRNAGSGNTPLEWTLDTSQLPNWLQVVNETAGSLEVGSTHVVRLRLVRGWLRIPGTYSTELEIESNGGIATAVVQATAGELFATPHVLTFGSEENSATLSLHNTSDDNVVWSASVDKGFFSVQDAYGVLEERDSCDLTVTINRDMFDGIEFTGVLTLYANSSPLVVPLRPRVTSVELTAPGPAVSLDVIPSSGASIGDLPLVAETDSVFDTAGVQFEAWVTGRGIALIGYDDEAPFTAVMPRILTFQVGDVALADLAGYDIELTAVADSRFTEGLSITSPVITVPVSEADPAVVTEFDVDSDGEITPSEALVDTDGDGLLDIGRYDFVGFVDVDDTTEQVVYSLRTLSSTGEPAVVVAPDGTVVDIPAGVNDTGTVQVLVVTAASPASLEQALAYVDRPTAADAAALAETAATGFGVGTQAGLSCVSVEVLGTSAPLSTYGGIAVGIPYADCDQNGFIDGTTISIDSVVPTVFADGMDVSVDAITGFGFDEQMRRGIVVLDRDCVVSLTRDIGQSGSLPDPDNIVDLITMLIEALLGGD